MNLSIVQFVFRWQFDTCKVKRKRSTTTTITIGSCDRNNDNRKESRQWRKSKRGLVWGIRENAQSQGGANGPLQITTLETGREYSTNLYLR